MLMMLLGDAMDIILMAVVLGLNLLMVVEVHQEVTVVVAVVVVEEEADMVPHTILNSEVCAYV